MTTWDLLLLQLHHDFDSNGVCENCGFELPRVHCIDWAPDPEDNRPVQRVTFLNPVTIQGGETFANQLPLVDAEGEVLQGEFLAEIKPNNVIKIIGRG